MFILPSSHLSGVFPRDGAGKNDPMFHSVALELRKHVKDLGNEVYDLARIKHFGFCKHEFGRYLFVSVENSLISHEPPWKNIGWMQ